MSDPNQLDDEEYIVRLVGKVVTVSVETVRLVKELEQTVTLGGLAERGSDHFLNLFSQQGVVLRKVSSPAAK